ncbi:alkene reductase [Pollutimonas sp. M17]|uniref:alkene reductase n=1 Tax=Pollutimonas sp. M17 TaxID=2962065 RepID=UPI0021F4C1E6|nr:alkene reductase [Pollutimonas sp. M17]UYO92197.1 alkene reductase [Pollutimonas sp. M17]HWK70206.1 alkene reductase [Burkholderiaceae bacterium]
MTSLFDPIELGAVALSNRIVMAPLTRNRASDGRVPNDLMRSYYCQRATAGLILSEATSVSPQGVGYPCTPGIWSSAQVEGWKKITQAVHGKGGKIFLQLWHVGRVSDPEFLNGEIPVAPSAIACQGNVSLLRPKRPYVVPRALHVEEIPGIVNDFARAAQNAREAGFDGVEVHAANGYLIDQFLQDGVNKRHDEYGGSVENRARLLLEVVDACVGVWGAGRVGVHLSPRGDAHSMSDSNPRELFSHVARALGQRGIAFIFTREALGEDSLTAEIRGQFGGPVIVNENYDIATAQSMVSQGRADAVAFGKAFIANPDLVARLKAGASLNDWDPGTFYTAGPKGYIDYPFLSGAASPQKEACS